MGDIFNQNVQRNKRCIGRQITKLSFLKHHYVNVLPHNNSFRLMLVVQHLVTGWWCLCNLCLLYVISVRGEDHSITYMFTATYRTCQNIVWVLSRLLSVVVSRPFGPISKSPPIAAVHIQRGDESTGSEGTVKERERKRERANSNVNQMLLPTSPCWFTLNSFSFVNCLQALSNMLQVLRIFDAFPDCFRSPWPAKTAPSVFRDLWIYKLNIAFHWQLAPTLLVTNCHKPGICIFSTVVLRSHCGGRQVPQSANFDINNLN